MEQKQTLFLEYDGGCLAEVCGWRLAGSIAGDSLQWRFILPLNRTLVVKPLPIPSNERPFCVPGHIYPALGSVTWLIQLAHQRCSVVGGPNKYLDHNTITQSARQQIGHAARDIRDNIRTALSEKAEKEDPAKWQAAHEQHITGLFTKTFGTALAKATAEEKAQRLAKFKAEFGTEKKRRNFIYAQLCSQHQKQHPEIWSKAKAEDDAESAAEEKLTRAAAEELAMHREKFYREVSLYEINQFLRRHTGESPVAVTVPNGRAFTVDERAAIVTLLEKSKLLNEIYQFILVEVRPAGEPSNTIVTQADCRKLVHFIGQKVGKDLLLSVLKAYHPQMIDWLKEWSRELAKTRSITESAAVQYVEERIQYVTECEGRSGNLHIYPIEELKVDVSDQVDVESHEISKSDSVRAAFPAAGTVTTTTLILKHVQKFVSEFAVTMTTRLEEVKQDVAAWQKDYRDVQNAKARLEKLQSDGLMKFAAKVDAKSFHILCAIIAQGDVAKASRALKMSDSTVRDVINNWKERGPSYAVMSDLVRWRKRVGGKYTVPFNDALLYEKDGVAGDESVFSELLDAVLSMTETNWQDICAELESVLKKQLGR